MLSFGGTRNALAISWPKRIRTSKKFRSQFHHVVDIFPTLLETAGIDVPEYVSGIRRNQFGKSMLYSFDDGDCPSTRSLNEILEIDLLPGWLDCYVFLIVCKLGLLVMNLTEKRSVGSYTT